MATIFIWYRRGDSGPAAGRIYDRLEAHFGRGQVFMDVDDIPLGVDWRDWLDRQVRGADLVLAVIGRDWLRAAEDAHQGRHRPCGRHPLPRAYGPVDSGDRAAPCGWTPGEPSHTANHD